MSFTRRVHDFHLTEALSLLLHAFDFFDQDGLGGDRRPDAGHGFFCGQRRGGLPWGGGYGVSSFGEYQDNRETCQEVCGVAMISMKSHALSPRL
jgi:hypothetical protein